ncbi:MAG TPA: hypothetical protein VFB26_10375 [Gaiellaceae bacterium]|nr:hypothetical protein [Gaiellaceae bacterium]
MPVWLWVVVAVAAAVAVVAAAGAVLLQRRRARSAHLRERFGPEYVRAVAEAPSRAAAEKELAERERRSGELDIRPLAPESRERFAQRWREVQQRFVDDPGGAVRDADRLVQAVMGERGYPTADFEQRAADLSVANPELVASYRAAHETYERQLSGKATTEELRHAVVDYRAVFDGLLAAEQERAPAR